MIYNVQDFSVNYAAMGVAEPPRKTTLTSYILTPSEVEWVVRPAIIICPGGGDMDLHQQERLSLLL